MSLEDNDRKRADYMNAGQEGETKGRIRGETNSQDVFNEPSLQFAFLMLVQKRTFSQYSGFMVREGDRCLSRVLFDQVCSCCVLALYCKVVCWQLGQCVFYIICKDSRHCQSTDTEDV